MLDNFLFWDYENKKNPIEILLKKNSPPFLSSSNSFLRNSDRIFFSFFFNKTFASKEGNIIEATRVDSATPYYDSSHRTWYRTVSPATGRTGERETKVQGDWERNKGAMVEGERERERLRSCIFAKSSPQLHRGVTPKSEQREREREVLGDKSKEDKRSSRRRYFFPFLLFLSVDNEAIRRR